MKFEIVKATREDRGVLHKLMQLYLYDLSAYSGDELNEQGEYFYQYLDLYWSEKNRHAFLIKVKGRLAGFVLVADYVVTERADRSIAEFFIIREFRRKGIGKKVARKVFDLFPGDWEVRAISSNKPARRFWKQVIKAYTSDSYQFLRNGESPWDGPIWTFCNIK